MASLPKGQKQEDESKQERALSIEDIHEGDQVEYHPLHRRDSLMRKILSKGTVRQIKVRQHHPSITRYI
jgi:hypothetical protein